MDRPNKNGNRIGLNSVDSLVLLYQAVISAVILGGNLPADQKMRLCLIHGLVAVFLLGVFWLARDWDGEVWDFVHGFYPLAAMLFFYKEIGLLVHSYFEWSLDGWLLGVDDEMGKIGLRIWNFQRFYPPVRLLNEFFSVGYAFYFILLPMAALVIYFKADSKKFRAFMFSLSFTYYLHYLIFIFLPAESPRFFMPGLRESLRGYWVSDWLQVAVEKNAFPGGSFPSSHIAASIICFKCYPYLGKWRFPVLFMTLAMWMGTIYGRYHYFVDVLAGLGLGFCCYYLAPWLERKWPMVSGEEGIVRGRSREAFN